MIPGLQSSIDGIQVAQLRMDVSSHDVANVNTPGFEESRVLQSASANGGVQASAIVRTPNPNPEVSGTDLARERVEQISAERELEANASSLRTQDRMLGTILDIMA